MHMTPIHTDILCCMNVPIYIVYFSNFLSTNFISKYFYLLMLFNKETHYGITGKRGILQMVLQIIAFGFRQPFKLFTHDWSQNYRE